MITIILAVLQAYAHRYAVSPDGVSYLDLSDAVVNGRLSDLVNLYWSPLYPFLIGVGRAVAGAAPAREVPVTHAVNVVAFVGLLAAFEYFVIKIFELAAHEPRSALRGVWGTACTYGLFAFIALTLDPLELTTPDLLSNAAILVALGAMLRLHDTPRERRHAIVLGAALGLGMLAKSFLVPWAFVCFAVMAIDLRRAAVRPLLTAGVVWLVLVAPWTAILSARAGRLTFGDAGRLTYGWYVNGQDAPSLHVAAPGARAADTDALLPGIGVPGDAAGTNPMWFDPARWNQPVRPHFSFSDEIATVRSMGAALVSSISLLTWILFMLCVAPAESRRRAWSRAWVVVVPCLAGIAAYTLVILTARYIMAFLLATILIALATVPVARRIHPAALLVGIVVALLPLAISPTTRFGLAFAVACTAAMLTGALVPTRRHVLWVVAVEMAFLFSMILFGPGDLGTLRIAAAGLAIAIWVLGRGAIRRGTSHRFAYGLQMGLVFSAGLVFAGRLALRVSRDAGAAIKATSGSPETRIAADLAAHGVVPGTPIALIGPHAESYWARTARVKIVANVPDPIVPTYWMLPAARRDSILARFAERGARVAIVTRPPDHGPLDASWTPLRYGGWMRQLTTP